MSAVIMEDNQTRTPSKIHDVIRGAGVAIDDLGCIFRDGQLEISGRVRSYFDKQLVQESVRNLPGLSRIHNELQVRI